MRSLAEVGRATDLAGSVFPIVADATTGGTERQDQYFKEHDAIFNNAVDYWTPKPGEVGTAGQIAGQLAGGILQASISPALLVGTSQLSTAEDLTRQGVAPGAANVVGDIAGIGTAVGLKLPFLGNTLASRVLTGAVGNVAQGAATAAASHAVLDAAGNPVQAAQYDATDLKGRLLDAMMGAAFGGLAHIETKLTPTDNAALLVANQARHLEDSTAPARPATDADLTQHVKAMREAIHQTLNGEPVSVDNTLKGAQFIPDDAALRQRAEVMDEVLRAAREQAPEGAPIANNLMHQLDESTIGDPAIARARAAIAQNPDMKIPTGEYNPDGSPSMVRAADVMAHADATTAEIQAKSADVFRTAATCLLGLL